MFERLRFGLAAAFMFVLASVGQAFAGEDPKALIERLGGEAITLAAKAETTDADRLAGFEALFQNGFDVPLVSRIVLGRYWRVATPAEQEEFVSLFHRYIVSAYAERLNAYSGQTFEVSGTQVMNDKETLVKSVIKEPDGNQLKVDWRVLDRGGETRIIDVMVEGVSMAITHRSEFAAVISKTGQVETLLQRLRKQVGQS